MRLPPPARRTSTLLAGVLTLVVALAPVAAAAPPVPPTPPAPGGDVAARAAQVGGLVSRVSSLEAQLTDLTEQLGRRQEVANRALADDTAATVRADETRRAAADTRVRADAAAATAETARQQVDAWVAAWFQQSDVSSTTSVLTGATSPAEVLERAQLRDAVTAEQVEALDGLERARIEAGNADSRARAARIDADEAAARAAAARAGAEAELGRARAATDEQTRRIASVRSERDAAEAGLRGLEASDAGLAAQRRRAEAFDADAERSAAAADAGRRTAATARLATARVDPTPPTDEPDTRRKPEKPRPPEPDATEDPVRTVLDRALAQLGTVYSWGGGDADGPTRGVRDGGVADSFGDFDKVGFDCSGLMIYAFAGAGKTLPHYSGYQATAGQRLPLAERRPGDMLFWADDDGIHHVALYLGDDEMVEAPESGKVVRVAPVRFDDEIVPQVTRLLAD